MTSQVKITHTAGVHLVDVIIQDKTDREWKETLRTRISQGEETDVIYVHSTRRVVVEEIFSS